MQYIYLYTTETYRTKNWYKLGQSINHPRKRVLQQDNASNPEPLCIIAFWKVDNGITDKKIHKRLEHNGFQKLRDNREWFELSESPEQDIEYVLEELDANSKIGTFIDNSIVDIPVLNYQDIWWSK
jgi:hypothetical protein